MTLKSFYPSSFENYSVKEVGLKLNPSEMLRIRSRLNSLEQKIPAYSSIFLEYRESNIEKTAELSIQGNGHKFYSSSNGQDTFKMYMEMEQEIENQLLAWKKKRFTNSHVRNPFKSDQSKLTGGLFV